MILVYIDHGLGNQMFQYAMGIMLAEKVGSDNVLYDTSYLPKYIEKRKTHNINHIFRENFPAASYSQIHRITGRYPWIYRCLIRDGSDDMEKAPLKNNCRLVKEAAPYRITAQTIQNIRSIDWTRPHDYYVWGFWELPAYFAGVEDKIRSAFRFRHKLTADGKQKYASLFQPDSVSVHIRRGDFLKVSNKSFGRVCTRAYYDKAFEIIERKIENPMYVFFSDEPDYVEEEYKDIKRKMIIRGNPDYIDMQLISLCSHHICANSTFSFWGAFLDGKEDNITIAPQYLFMADESRRKWVPYPAMNHWIQIQK